MTIKTILLALFSLGVAFGQNSAPHGVRQPFPADNTPLTGEQWRLKLVARVMSQTGPLQYGVVFFHSMGDEAAVDVLKAVGAGVPMAAAQQQTALDIIHASFEQPASIIEPGNRKPLAALFLLQYIGAYSDDATVKERVAKEIAFAEAAAPPPPAAASAPVPSSRP